MQGKVPSVICDTKMEFYFDARIPEEYVFETSIRMEIYQRLGEAISMQEVDAIWKEMHDRFGPPHEPALWLYHLSRIRVFCSLNGITVLKIDKLSITAEQHKGKQTIARKFLLGKFKGPQDLEEKIIKSLKKEFSLI